MFGTKYKLSGWQMLKEKNAELLIDGKKVSNNYEFTADNEKMTVEIAFTFDGSSLGGKNLVTFEELYDMTNPDEPKKVTEHKDITDDGQTVTIKALATKRRTIKGKSNLNRHFFIVGCKLIIIGYFLSINQKF